MRSTKTLLLVLCVGVLFCVTGNQLAIAQDTTTGLEGYWTFDELEPGSTTAVDSSGNDRDATVGAGQPIPIAGKVGNAASFDGASDFLVPWKGIEGNNPRTVSLWVKTTQAGGALVGWGIATNGEKWHVRINDTAGDGNLGALRTEIQGDNIVSTAVVNDDQWHHVVSVFDGEFQGDVVHYVDGELDPMSGTSNDEIPVNTNVVDGQDLSIGSRLQGATWNRMTGAIDEVRVYSRALSAEDIQALFEEGQVEQSFATRSFSSSAVAIGDSVSVSLTLDSAGSGTLTEVLPDGWSASNISNDGSLDGNTITWELTGSINTVTYTATPDQEDAGRTFSGQMNDIFTVGESNITLLFPLEGDLNFHADIGSVLLEGEASFSDGTYFVRGSGDDIWNTADAFHFAFSEFEGPFRLSGESIVFPLDSTNDWVKGGLMVRNNLSPGSSNGMIQVRTDFQMNSQARSVQDAASIEVNGLTNDQLGQMIIERKGNQVNFYRIDLEGNEVSMGSITLEDLTDPVYAGVAITSHENGVISEVEFVDLQVELIPFTADRLVSHQGTGSPGFGDTFLVTLDVYARSSQDVTVSETVPEGWSLSDIMTESGSAADNGSGGIDWTIPDHQGYASLTYTLTAPSSSEEPIVTGEFSGEANGSSISGDTTVTVSGIVPQEILDQQDIESGLAGHWSFDEGSGDVAADASGNDRHAEIWVGDPVWVDGVMGSAVEFTNDNAFYTPEWWGLEGATPRTVSFWMKSTDLDAESHGIVGWGLSSSNGTKYHVRINNNAGNGVLGALRTEIQGTFNVATTDIADDQWHFVTSVFPENGQFMADVVHYVDGIQEMMSGTNANSTSILVDTAASPEVSDQEFRIGMRMQGTAEHYYTGLVDEVRVYERGLSPLEVQALFMASGGPQETGIEDYMLY